MARRRGAWLGDLSHDASGHGNGVPATRAKQICYSPIVTLVSSDHFLLSPGGPGAQPRWPPPKEPMADDKLDWSVPEPPASRDQVEAFVRATAGGFGSYVESSLGQVRFRQQDTAGSVSFDDIPGSLGKLGYGRIDFVGNSKDAKDSPYDQPKHYIRVPAQSNASMILHFVENVWKISRPKLIIGWSQGYCERDFYISY